MNPVPKSLHHVSGILEIERRGHSVKLTRASIPETLISRKGLKSLPLFDSLKGLSLSGKHFATTRLNSRDIKELSETILIDYLSVHGILADEETLLGLIREITVIEELDVRGLPFNKKVLSICTDRFPDLKSLKIGYAKRNGTNHIFKPSGIEFLSLNTDLPFVSLKELSLRGINILEDFHGIQGFESLQSLDCGDMQLTANSLNAIATVDSFQKLDFDGAQFESSDIVNFFNTLKSSSLRKLDLSNTQVKDETVESITRFKKLESLSIENAYLSASGIQALANFSEIKELNLNYSQAPSHVISSIIPELKRLESLRVKSIDFDAEELGAFRELKSVHLSATFSENIVKELSSFEGLEELSISKFVGRALPQSLKSLSISEISYEVLASESLENLYINTPLPLLEKSNLINLKEFLAQGRNLEDQSLINLAERKHLEALFISDNPLSDIGIKALLGMDNLHTLELRNCRSVSDKSMAVINSLPSIHCLDLNGTSVTVSGIAQLKDAPQLQSLALDAQQLSEESISNLAQLDSLIELYLYGDGFTSSQFELLANLPYLLELNLFGTGNIDEASRIAISNLKLRQVRGVFRNVDTIGRIAMR